MAFTQPVRQLFRPYFFTLDFQTTDTPASSPEVKQNHLLKVEWIVFFSLLSHSHDIRFLCKI